MAQSSPPRRVAFQEFEMYYQSAERVTDRRHELNRWNYSVVAATLIAIGLVLGWATSDRSHVLIGVSGIAILCIMGGTLCTYWIKQISDFKELNSAKFKILNE